MSFHTKERISSIVYHTLVILFGFLMIYPLLWMVMASFKDNSEIFQKAATLLPSTFKFSNYSNGWKGFGGISFATFFKNSLFITIIGTVGTIVSSALVGYAFGRLEFKFKKAWFTAMMVTMILPFQIIMIPQFILFQKLGWVGTFKPLIVPHFFGAGFFIFLTVQFIQGIPKDLDEAAKIDGCSPYGIFFRVILPLIKPAIITSTIFSFMWKWDDFLGSLLYLNQPSKYTVSLALKMFADPSAQSDYGSLFAMATLSLIPIFVIFLIFQKYLVQGVATSGLKG